MIFGLSNVSDVIHRLTPSNRFVHPTRRDWTELAYLSNNSRICVHRGEVKILAVERAKRSFSGIAQLDCLLDDRVEDRLQIAGRGVGDAQDLRRGGLLG